MEATEPGAPSVERSGSSDRVTRSRSNSLSKSGPSPPMHPYSRPVGTARPPQEQLSDARPESSSPKGSSSIGADGPSQLTASARKLTVKSKPFWETREKSKSEQSEPAITPSGLTPLLRDQAQIWPGATVDRVSPLLLGSASPSAASPAASPTAAQRAGQRNHGTTAPVFGGVRLRRNQALHGRPAQAADWPRLAGARGSLMRALPLKGASREIQLAKALPPCYHLVVDAGVSVSVSKDFSKGFSAAAAAESSSNSSGSGSAKDAKETKHRRTSSGSWPFGSRKAPQPAGSATDSSIV